MEMQVTYGSRQVLVMVAFTDCNTNLKTKVQTQTEVHTSTCGYRYPLGTKKTEKPTA